MMDKITEELITGMIRRLDDFDERLRKIESGNYRKKPVWKTNPRKPATEKQIIAVQQRGGEVWEGMTQADIEKQFQLINQKNSPQESQKRTEPGTGEGMQPEGKPLTKEEIEEIGEDNLL